MTNARREAAQEKRDQHVRSLTEDPRWKQELNGSDRRHMRALLTMHNPLTGHLEQQTSALELATILEVSEEALRQSRLRLIKAGLIVAYEPGTGRTVSRYRIARSWNEADEAAVSRPEPVDPISESALCRPEPRWLDRN